MSITAGVFDHHARKIPHRVALNLTTKRTAAAVLAPLSAHLTAVLLRRGPDVANVATSLDTAFRVRGVTKVYGTGAGEVRALRGVDLDIRRGETLVLLGPSGSGKSTLLNILGGLDRPTSGSVVFHDRDLAQASSQELTKYRRQAVGFIFQFFNLMPSLTARENVELITEIADQPMNSAEALALVDLSARMNHFPAQLSGGQQQRVAVARAIAKRPELLFCDEPTGSLDSASGVQVIEAILNVARQIGATTLIVTHNAVVADIADRVVRFSNGAVVDVKDNATKRAPSELAW
jgi:putative ABC transport system ATP-binding protein